MRWWRVPVVVLLLLAAAGCGLGPEPQLVYSWDAPDLDTPDHDPVPDLEEGDDAFVTLRDGSRFEAKYLGHAEGLLEFVDVEWTGPAGRGAGSRFECPLEDVSEIRRRDWGTADTAVAVASIAGLVTILAVYGRGDGAD